MTEHSGKKEIERGPPGETAVATNLDTDTENLVRAAQNGDSSAGLWISEMKYCVAILELYNKLPNRLRILIKRDLGFHIEAWLADIWCKYYKSESGTYLEIQADGAIVEVKYKTENESARGRTWVMKTLQAILGMQANADLLMHSINRRKSTPLRLNEAVNALEHLLDMVKVKRCTQILRKGELK